MIDSKTLMKDVSAEILLLIAGKLDELDAKYGAASPQQAEANVKAAKLTADGIAEKLCASLVTHDLLTAHFGTITKRHYEQYVSDASQGALFEMQIGEHSELMEIGLNPHFRSAVAAVTAKHVQITA